MLYMDASIRTKRQEKKPFWRRKKSKERERQEESRKKERKKKRKVVGYNSYKFSYKGTEWKVKVEIHEKGFEQFYAIVK